MCWHVIGVGSNSILGGGGGANVIYTAIAAICAACMNINKVSRVKYWGGGGGGGGPGPPCPPGSYAYACDCFTMSMTPVNATKVVNFLQVGL